MDSTTQTRLQKMCPFSESLPFAACYSFLLADGRRDIFQTPLSSCPRVAMSIHVICDNNHVRFLCEHNVYIINVFCKIQNGVLQGNAGSDLSALP